MSSHNLLRSILREYTPIEIGRVLRRLREEVGLKEYELAARAGFTDSTVSDWERGKTRAKWTSLARALKALESTPHELERELRRLRRQSRPATSAVAPSGRSDTPALMTPETLWEEAQQISGEVGSAIDRLLRFLLRLVISLWAKLNGPGGAEAAGPPSAADR